MDEVDGRPGHVALQSGHMNAPQGVPAVSLSFLNPILKKCTVILSEQSESKDLRFRSLLFIQSPCLFSGADQPEALGPTAGGEAK